MFDLKDDDFDDSIELNINDQIKNKITEGLNLQILIVILLKLGIIGIGPAVIKVQEIYNINLLNNQLEQVKSETQIVDNQIAEIENQIKQYDSSKEKKKDFENKEKILTQLAQERLRIIGILDHLQQAVGTVLDKDNPTVFMFLDRITVNNRNIKIDASANNDSIVNEFLSQLEDESLYSSVRLEQISSQRDSLKKFLVTGLIKQDREN